MHTTPKSEQKKRRCLACLQMFASRGVGNRICCRCAGRQPQLGKIRLVSYDDRFVNGRRITKTE